MEGPLDNGAGKTPLRKSASFSSSSTSTSQSQSQSPASSSLGSATSTMSLRSSTPLRGHQHSASTRALRSDTINTFQKWETTIESISYVSTKTVSISDFGEEPQLREQTDYNHTHRTAPPPPPPPLYAVRSTLYALHLCISQYRCVSLGSAPHCNFHLPERETH
ncbi:GL24632 [Drosophila persimilis]|uniref:GL24632 n=1 Tax=Drosophila persimilis TaxID=7234 RepID=B4H5S3_DROPE|nr:GL24632 [Drosophila persimilis]